MAPSLKDGQAHMGNIDWLAPIMDINLSDIPYLFSKVQEALSGSMVTFGKGFIPPAEIARQEGRPYNPPDRGPHILAFSIVTLAITGLVVILRFIARIRRSGFQNIGADDYMMIVSLILVTGFTTTICVAVKQGCMGRHVYDCSINSVVLLIKTMYAHSLVYLATACSIKISILLFYRRLIGAVSWKMTWALRALMALVVVFTIISMFVLAFFCRPAYAYWDLILLHDGYCPTSEILVARYQTILAIHMVSDFVILIFPMKLVYDLSLPLKQKLILIVLFGAGTLACVASILRLAFIPGIRNSIDLTHNCVAIAFWGQLEATTAMVAASIPTLRSLFRRRSKRQARKPNFFSSLSTTGFSKKFGLHRDSRDERDRDSGHGGSNGSTTTSEKKPPIMIHTAVSDSVLSSEPASPSTRLETDHDSFSSPRANRTSGDQKRHSRYNRNSWHGSGKGTKGYQPDMELRTGYTIPKQLDRAGEISHYESRALPSLPSQSPPPRSNALSPSAFSFSTSGNIAEAEWTRKASVGHGSSFQYLQTQDEVSPINSDDGSARESIIIEKESADGDAEQNEPNKRSAYFPTGFNPSFEFGFAGSDRSTEGRESPAEKVANTPLAPRPNPGLKVYRPTPIGPDGSPKIPQPQSPLNKEKVDNSIGFSSLRPPEQPYPRTNYAQYRHHSRTKSAITDPKSLASMSPSPRPISAVGTFISMSPSPTCSPSPPPVFPSPPPLLTSPTPDFSNLQPPSFQRRGDSAPSTPKALPRLTIPNRTPSPTSFLHISPTSSESEMDTDSEMEQSTVQKAEAITVRNMRNSATYLESPASAITPSTASKTPKNRTFWDPSITPAADAPQNNRAPNPLQDATPVPHPPQLQNPTPPSSPPYKPARPQPTLQIPQSKPLRLTPSPNTHLFTLTDIWTPETPAQSHKRLSALVSPMSGISTTSSGNPWSPDSNWSKLGAAYIPSGSSSFSPNGVSPITGSSGSPTFGALARMASVRSSTTASSTTTGMWGRDSRLGLIGRAVTTPGGMGPYPSNPVSPEPISATGERGESRMDGWGDGWTFTLKKERDGEGFGYGFSYGYDAVPSGVRSGGERSGKEEISPTSGISPWTRKVEERRVSYSTLEVVSVGNGMEGEFGRV